MSLAAEQSDRPTLANQSSAPFTGAVARSGLWATGGNLAVLAASFFATPFTIRLLGPASYGLWALLASVLSYLTIADLGMSDASTTFAADRYAHRDARGEAAVIWTALAVTVTITSAAALAACLASPYIVVHVLHVRPGLRSEATLAIRLVAAASVATAVSTSTNTPQQVRLHWRSLTLATSGPSALQVAIAPLVLLLLGGGVTTMALLTIIAALAAATLNMVGAVRRQRELLRPGVHRDLLRPMVKYGAALAVSGFALIPLTTAERFFLAYFHSPRTVAFYAVAAGLGSLLFVLPVAISRPLIPALTRLTSEGRVAEHHQLYHRALRTVFVVLTPLALVVAFLARPFLSLWAGPAYGAHSTSPLYVILAGLWFNTLAYLPAVQLMSSRQTRILATLRLAELLPYLAVAAALTSAYGTVGAAATWTIRAVVDSVALFVVVGRAYRLPWVPTPRRTIGSLVVIACTAVLLWALATATSSLAARCGCGVVVLALYGVAMWRLIFTRRERAEIASVLEDLLPRHIRRGNADIRGEDA